MALIGQSEPLDLVFWMGAGLFFGLALLSRAAKALRYALPAVPPLIVGLCVSLGEWEGIRDLVNWLCEPDRLFLLAAMTLVLALVYYRRWTHPLLAGLMFAILALAYCLSALDDSFFRIISKPDNVPITLMVFSVGLVLWVALRRMAINDRRIERGEPPGEGDRNDKVMVWPDLVFVELVIMVASTAALILWALFVRAPLEPPANPTVVPNPSKAPWYFVGLQELLVYFDPWLAGVLLPVLIIFGLCALPYLDRNPKGSGYYTFAERRFAISTYLFGFLLLWVLLIVLGTFLRGPNWSFFGPYERWDPHKSAVLLNVNLSDVFWINWLGKGLPTRESTGSHYHYLIREAPGLIVLAAYFGLAPLLLKATVFKRMYAQMGRARYAVMMVLLTWMALVPIKMLLRWLFNLKYILAITEWSFNI